MNAKPSDLYPARHRIFTRQQVGTVQLNSASGWYLLLMLLCDIALTEAALWLAAVARQILPFGPTLWDEGWLTSQVYLIAPIMVIIINTASGVYKPEHLQSARREITAVLRAAAISTVVLAGLMYFFERQLSRWLFIYYGLFQALLMIVARLAARGLCRWWQIPLTVRRRIAIVGAGSVGQAVAGHLRQMDPAYYQLLGFIDAIDNVDAGPSDWPVLGTLERAESIVRAWKVDELVITLPVHARDQLAQLMQSIHDSPVQVSVIPDYFDLAYLYARSDELANIPIIRLKEPALTMGQRTVKRVFDIVFGSMFLVIAAPVLLISALAIRHDSAGPIVYRQRRAGEGGREFWMYKLRTMVDNADQQEARLIRMQDNSVQFDKLPDDPRITHVGKLLRRWSIDELPQLINVLKGEMSLIGPRPELPNLVARYTTWQRKRFAVPQGITGWWQVNGRPQDVDLKVEYDLYYVRNYSVWLDFWILLKTIGAVFGRKGAF
jgi:exopolysaccharide biosynthesis polyprenyl glycosylphosphotransferase